jgi:hypothetical protein
MAQSSPSLRPDFERFESQSPGVYDLTFGGIVRRRMANDPAVAATSDRPDQLVDVM